MKGTLGYAENDVVSIDFIGDNGSNIFYAEAGIALNEKFLKIVAWWDNEWDYNSCVINLSAHMLSSKSFTHIHIITHAYSFISFSLYTTMHYVITLTHSICPLLQPFYH